MNKNTKLIRSKNLLLFLALLSLVAAYMIGQIQKKRESRLILLDNLPAGIELTKKSDQPQIFYAQEPAVDSIGGYYVINSANGWGGPLLTATHIDPAGFIQDIMVLSHKETPSFFYKLQKKDFFLQFTGKNVSAPLLPKTDVDIISQATVSSRAFTQAIREGSHAIGKKIFNMKITEKQTEFIFGLNEILLIALIGMLAVAMFRKLKILRFIGMLGFFIFLGFYLNSSLSIAHIAALMLGYFPPFRTQLLWWILVAAVLLFALIWKKNIYCYGMCPFGNLQEFNAKISGINLAIAPKVIKFLKPIPYVLTWAALMIIFLYSTPVLGAYEPFSTLFGLQGIEIQWLILPMVILGSFVIARFFCRYFCPLGIIMKIVIKMRQGLESLFKVRI